MSKLSTREVEVLNLIAWEQNNKQIASTLYISENTVKSHRKNMMIKLQVLNAAGLVRRGIELGYIALQRAS